ncbi:LytR/AlgR family response regulator transcription factor [Paenibacillus chartarius]|uniref:LytR/AlgR family response regulator transcription factor n=1 Tax=Paenibacillus chartarius TaxID=747481 RepID=A0ABV6DLI0_9BACL
MKVMIAEDERLARDELMYLLSQEDDVEILACADNGTELLELVRLQRPHVVFLDIHMPGLNGVETAERLQRQGSAPYIVFATAYEQFALDAFRLEAVDYVLKPYEEERLRKTLQRIRARLSETPAWPASAAGALPPPLPAEAAQLHAKPPAAGVKPKLLIEDGSRMLVIDPAAIAYAVKEEKRTLIHMADGQVHTARQTLQELELRFGPYAFFRSHRSHLVNVDCIEEIEPWFNGAYNLILKDARHSRIPLSRGAAKELMHRLQGM